MHGLIAYDMISQAEHGTDSVAALITTSEKLAVQVQENSLNCCFCSQSRKNLGVTIQIWLHNHMRINGEAVALTNQFAAEHFEVMTNNAQELAEKLVAGLILIGPYSPVP
jgi:histidinol dehydrogenase